MMETMKRDERGEWVYTDTPSPSSNPFSTDKSSPPEPCTHYQQQHCYCCKYGDSPKSQQQQQQQHQQQQQQQRQQQQHQLDRDFSRMSFPKETFPLGSPDRENTAPQFWNQSSINPAYTLLLTDTAPRYFSRDCSRIQNCFEMPQYSTSRFSNQSSADIRDDELQINRDYTCNFTYRSGTDLPFPCPPPPLVTPSPNLPLSMPHPVAIPPITNADFGLIASLYEPCSSMAVQSSCQSTYSLSQPVVAYEAQQKQQYLQQQQQHQQRLYQSVEEQQSYQQHLNHAQQQQQHQQHQQQRYQQPRDVTQLYQQNISTSQCCQQPQNMVVDPDQSDVKDLPLQIESCVAHQGSPEVLENRYHESTERDTQSKREAKQTEHINQAHRSPENHLRAEGEIKLVKEEVKPLSALQSMSSTLSSSQPPLPSTPALRFITEQQIQQKRQAIFHNSPSSSSKLLPNLLATIEPLKGTNLDKDSEDSGESPEGSQSDPELSPGGLSALSGSGSSLFTFSPLLPPCRVCGAKASGFHYGANTCEACKGFFRRSLQKREKYSCIGKGHCEIVNTKRTLCGACRYRKCLSIGMSKHAIKTGRYTHAKKTKDTEEVKRLQLRQRTIAEGVGGEGVGGGVVEGLGGSRVLTDQELEKILQRITSAHKLHYAQLINKSSEKEREFVEQKCLREQVFGTLRPIPTDEYMKIYEITGIDVDGRRDLLEGIVPLVEGGIRRFIAFAKSIPGFIDLPIDDQIGIIKASRFEAWLVLNHRMFNQELRLYTTALGFVICADDLVKVYDQEYIDMIFATQERISNLGLTYDEMCLLGAFSMMFTDRCTLSNPSRVEKTQGILLQCFHYLQRKHQSEDRLSLARITDLLVQLRHCRYYQLQAEENLAQNWSDKIQLPALIYEMWIS